MISPHRARGALCLLVVVYGLVAIDLFDTPSIDSALSSSSSARSTMAKSSSHSTAPSEHCIVSIEDNDRDDPAAHFALELLAPTLSARRPSAACAALRLLSSYRRAQRVPDTPVLRVVGKRCTRRMSYSYVDHDVATLVSNQSNGYAFASATAAAALRFDIFALEEFTATRATLGRCSMATCFDRRGACARGAEHFRFHVYSRPKSTRKAYFSQVIARMHDDLKRHPLHTEDKDDACVFVVPIDTLNWNYLLNFTGYRFDGTMNEHSTATNFSAQLRQLSHWHSFGTRAQRRLGGVNHLIVTMFVGNPPYFFPTYVARAAGFAMFAVSSPTRGYFRQSFDVSLPHFLKYETRTQLTACSVYAAATSDVRTRARRNVQTRLHNDARWLLTFKGATYPRHLTCDGPRTQALSLAAFNDTEIALTCQKKQCCIDGVARAQSDALLKHAASLDFHALLCHSTFGWVPRGCRRGSYRLVESILAGSIPAISADDLVLPFDELLPIASRIVVGDDQKDVLALRTRLLAIARRPSVVVDALHMLDSRVIPLLANVESYADGLVSTFLFRLYPERFEHPRAHHSSLRTPSFARNDEFLHAFPANGTVVAVDDDTSNADLDVGVLARACASPASNSSACSPSSTLTHPPAHRFSRTWSERVTILAELFDSPIDAFEPTWARLVSLSSRWQRVERIVVVATQSSSVVDEVDRRLVDTAELDSAGAPAIDLFIAPNRSASALPHCVPYSINTEAVLRVESVAAPTTTRRALGVDVLIRELDSAFQRWSDRREASVRTSVGSLESMWRLERMLKCSRW